MKRALLLLLCFAPALRAEDRSPLSVGLAAIGGTPMGSGLKDYDDTVGLGARIKYEGGERWSGGVQWASFRFTREPLDPVTLTPITAFAQRRFGWSRTWVPYALADLGFSRNTRGRALDESDTRWTAGLGGGLQWNFYDLGGVSLEAGIRHFDGALPSGSAQVAHAGLVFSFYLPESWVPMFPDQELTLEDLESPLANLDGVDENLQTQGELNRLTAQIEEGKFPPIAFELGKSVLLTSSYESLDNVGAILQRHPQIRVRIYGFVEELFTGTQERADTLALARSEVVRTYLMQNNPQLSEENLFSAGLPPTPDLGEGETPPPLPPYVTFEVVP